MSHARDDLEIRSATAADVEFLAEMLVEAAHPPWFDPKPTPRQAVDDEVVGRYLADWGRRGDTALIAFAAGQPIGAAWYRRFSEAEPGHGFVAADIPEVAIAVVADWRGRGVGRALLTSLVTAARLADERALSLIVSAGNPVARHLYESLGFRRVSGSDDHPILRLDFAAAAPPGRRGRILVVSGPPGAGKTTVSDLVADRLEHSVVIRGDDFFHSVRRGYIDPWLPEARDQNVEVIRAIAAAARAAIEVTVVGDTGFEPVTSRM